MNKFSAAIMLFCSTLLFSCGGGPFNINEQGGTLFTVQTDALDFLLTETAYTRSPAFALTLEQTVATRAPHNHAFIDAFAQKFSELHPGQALSHLFAVSNNGKYKPNMSNQEVIRILHDEYTSAVTRTTVILEHRLEFSGLSKSEFSVSKNKEGNVLVAIAARYPAYRLRQLIGSSGRFGFYETYMPGEVGQELETLNKTLSAALYPGLDTMPVQETMEYKQMKYPMFKYLQISTVNTLDGSIKYQENACYGMAKMADTSAVNQMLRHPDVQNIFPRDLHLLWALNTEELGGQHLLSLYLVKAKNFYDPEISGSVITEAHAGKDEHLRNTVNMNMTSEGAEKWKEMTKRNMRRCIAMVFEGRVVSAPTVVSVIPNGETVISGSFSEEEAIDLAAILRSAAYPSDILILDEKKVEPKK